MPESRAGKPGNITVRKRLSSLLALLVLAFVAAVCISLGFWQLDRAAQRDALHQQIEHGRQQPALSVSADTPTSELQPWRPATIEGRWANEYTVLLQNRNLDGRPGYWVATPLLLTHSPSQSAGTTTETPAPAVLVLRGWLPRDMQAEAGVPDVLSEEGIFQVSGELHTHVPRIFELWDWAGGASSQLPALLPQGEGGLPQVQNLDLGEYAQATGLKLMPTVLAQTSESVALTLKSDKAITPATNGPTVNASLQREWPGPALDSDQNRGYALQWFGFSGIALIAALLVLRSLLRRDDRNTRSKEAP